MWVAAATATALVYPFSPDIELPPDGSPTARVATINVTNRSHVLPAQLDRDRDVIQPKHFVTSLFRHLATPRHQSVLHFNA